VKAGKGLKDLRTRIKKNLHNASQAGKFHGMARLIYGIIS
jgi:hypothetical protein